MWNILTQKELLLTLDLNRQAEMRKLLSLHGIEYRIHTKNLQGSGPFGGGARRTEALASSKIVFMNTKFMYRKKSMSRRNGWFHCEIFCFFI